jgi:hypothetical protein
VFTAVADDEGLIDCPNCGMWFPATDPEAEMETPVRPKLHWLDADTAKVFVGEHHIADLFWNGMEWFFMPLLQASSDPMPVEFWSHIRVDMERWAELREKQNALNAKAHERPEAERAALSAELELQRNEFRDDTKDFAAIAAIGKGRIWWRTAWSEWLKGCNGMPDTFGGPVLHDWTESCPVHEV